MKRRFNRLEHGTNGINGTKKRKLHSFCATNATNAKAHNRIAP